MSWAARACNVLPAVYDLVLRLRRRTGLDLDLHWFRHFGGHQLRESCRSRSSPRSWVIRGSPPPIAVYGHLTVEEARRALEAAGWFSAAGTVVAW